MGKRKIIFFFSETCVVCSMVKPILYSIAEEINIPIKSINVDEDGGKEKAKKYDITDWPTSLIVEDGIIRNVVKGYSPALKPSQNRKIMKARIEASFE